TGPNWPPAGGTWWPRRWHGGGSPIGGSARRWTPPTGRKHKQTKQKDERDMKIACISLGCPENQVDLDGMVYTLLAAGHETVADIADADMVLVNTCGFIESAKTEAIENILEACSYKQQNPALKVVVTGCLAERYRSQIRTEIPEVDAVVGCA